MPEQVLMKRAIAADEAFMGDIHESHWLATLRGRDDVFFCRLLLGGQRCRFAEATQALAELERGTMPNDRVPEVARRAFQRVVPCSFLQWCWMTRLAVCTSTSPLIKNVLACRSNTPSTFSSLAFSIVLS